MQRIPWGSPSFPRARKPGAKRTGESQHGHLDVHVGEGPGPFPAFPREFIPLVARSGRNSSSSREREDGARGLPSELLPPATSLPRLPAPPVFPPRPLPSPASPFSGHSPLRRSSFSCPQDLVLIDRVSPPAMSARLPFRSNKVSE
jgi:hypothetical protein